MRKLPPARPMLLGVFAAALLTALATGVWVLMPSRPAQTAEEALPTPPEPPRLVDAPEFERCVGLLRTDPDAALSFAGSWQAEADAGPASEGARHCHGLALLALGEPEIAAERLEALAGQSQGSPAARAAVFGQAGQAWLMAGDAGRAYGAVTMALTLMPGDTELLTDRAVAAATLGRYAEALEDLDHVLATEPQRAEALVFRAAALRHLDRVDRAAEDIELALAAEPENAEALLERGILRQLRGDASGARADWERAIELAPDSATADLAMQNLALNEAGPARR
jgi:tetratricopeptide (TPR) repeat protein